ncbi:MAG: tRNA methyltransferase [Fimbriimonadia bacterium]|jgi:tRNA (guanosine-2'-O-)-methyltransferase
MPHGHAIRKKTALRKERKAFESQHPPQKHLAFLLQDWQDGYNVGGMFRVAAACGARELVLVGRTPTPPHPMIGVTSMGMHRRVPFRTFEKWTEALTVLKQEGYSLVAVEVAEGAEHYMAFEYPQKTCLVLGAEGGGIGNRLIEACDAAVYIPMYGKGRSLNVHVAAAVVAFELMLRGTEGHTR